MKKRAKKSSKVRSNSKAKKIDKNLFGEIWPQERDIILRPERLKYVRKLIHMEGCVFCSARDGGVKSETLCLYKNENAMVILNKYPYNTGHLMVLPVRHCGDMTELSSAEYTEMMSLLRRVAEVVKAEYRVDGMNIGLNMGAVAGAGLPKHLHWHVIPRWTGDTNFFPIIAETKVIPESIEQTYARYAKHFADEGA